MAGLTWTSALRDMVAQMVLQTPYASLRATESGVLDGGTAVPTTTPGGLAGHSLTYVNMYAQWFTEATESAANSPADWEPLLAAEIAYRFCKAVRPSGAGEFGKDLMRAWQTTTDAYANLDATAAGVQDGTTPSLKTIRLFVMRHLLRKRPRQFVPIGMIDQAARAAWEEIWHHGVWNFRVRLVTVTLPLASPAAPTMDLPAGEVFHSIVSPKLIYIDSSSGTGQPDTCEYADSAQMSTAMADTTTTSQRPQKFMFEQRLDGSKYWRWWPAPDQDYTFRAEVAIDSPTWPTSITSTVEFAQLPKTFQTVFLELVLGTVMKRASIDGWREPWQSAHDAMDGILQKYQSRGTPEEYAVQAEDVYHDGFGISRKL